MLKKLVCLVLIIAIAMAFSLTVFADPTGAPLITPTPFATPYATPYAAQQTKAADATGLEAVFAKVSDETTELYVDITRPDVDTESTYKKSYVITGVCVSDDTDVTVVLQVYDSGSESYVPLENTDGESQWKIGSFGSFSKVVELKDGPNKIRLLVYKTSQADSLKVEDIQVDKFTITLLKPGVKEAINKAIEFTTELLNKIGIKN